MKSIAVVGQGFVGGSLTTVFSERGVPVYAFDKSGVYKAGARACIPGTGSFPPEYYGADVGHMFMPASIEALVNVVEIYPHFSGVYFVCVPTPMYEDGSADLSIVESVLSELAAVPGKRIAVVKSTVPPGSTSSWNKKFASSGLTIVFNPEFLTEANALNDMRNQDRIVLGGPRPQINKVKQVFQSAFPNVPIIKTSSTTAEMVKYFTNVQLAARVILSCELYQICGKLDEAGHDIDYDKVKEYATYDKRLGDSHMNVPGPDGIPGARGHCFPKDLNALISVANDLGVNPAVMNALWAKNLEIIPPGCRDWEKMAGRAVSKKT